MNNTNNNFGTINERVVELNKIRERLFDLANSLAGNETGWAAVTLHNSCNAIYRVTEILKPFADKE